MDWLQLVGAIIISYLIGSISFSYLIGKLLRKLDIREHGSGNAGATNTLRVMGWTPAIIVLLLDCAKGIAAVVIGYQLTGIPVESGIAAGICGLAAILGHNWPIYFNFRGGKGVATTIGVLATLVFAAALTAGVVAIITIAVTRYVSLGSLLFISGTTLLTAVFTPWLQYPGYYTAFLVIITALSFWKHRDNISRLKSGTESKIGGKSDAKT
ncbi:glycerol-3-phosphate 1-O-acyltransferase PlsY [Salisediminibacterium halotolerans]|uniref:Glycerol-3-phosphate acyltransferase n=1 Tax=Salisediminibacterium halotolerans TaxID=517425 RepID=A0A1H9P535_9BACI|nr:glycerol-3-phosphate 1-O-acyltransferase PlsY [Salisediminibacterium haloalkalitolerans]SER42995.1 glycerol-3-phosphate acyltransferase PlsY [Salisediminibacterium haloalkalitolerans]